jgi:hypothetical protein
MKKYSTNRFYKGINTDLSYLERQGDVYLDALNVRITSKDTDGLFAANIKGNIEEFSLSPGFVPIGSTEYNGILFILSVNDALGLSEIGTFPSPNGTTEGFTRIYKPLNNYTLDNPNIFVDPCTGDPPNVINRLPMQSASLNFSCEHQARVLARITFDKSVNLYFTDNYNPLRSINTGFHSETGLYNNTFVSEDMIANGIIDIISENDKTPVVTLNRLKPTGSLKAGHYFFFVRYVDINFNTSSFLGMSAPIPIFNESIPNDYGNPSPQAVSPIAYGGEGQTSTNKSVVLDITNLDSTEGFFEVAYIYYYGEDTFEVKLIDNRIPIDGNSVYTNLEILGTESSFELSLDEVVAYKPVDAIFVKDITQINNQLYLANTRGKEVDHPDLRSFFCKIEIREDNSLQKPAEHFEKSEANENPYGVDEKDVNENAGYFSGEIYCFAAVPILKGGFVGNAFPLKGSDNVKGLLASENYQGIFRFSDAQTHKYFENNTAFIKGVKFDTTNAVSVYNNSAWLKENLIGLYFCRAKRNENLQYQGLAVPTWSGFELQDGPSKDFNSVNIAQTVAQLEYNDEFFIRVPSVERGAPYIYTVQRNVGAENFGLTSYQKYSVTDAVTPQTVSSDPRIGIKAGSPEERLSLGIFSFDYHIAQGQSLDDVGNNSYIKKIGEITDWFPREPRTDINDIVNPFGDKYVSIQYPDGVRANQEDYNSNRSKMFVQKSIDYKNDTDTKGGGFKADTYNTKNWDQVGINVKGVNYPTKVLNGGISQGLFYQRWDRENAEPEALFSLPLAIPAYILVDLTTSVPDNRSIYQWFNTIVNVYKQNPDDVSFDYTSFYDFKNTFFSPITGAINISDTTDIENVQNKIFYQGDCFVSRSYLKVQNKFDDALSTEILDFIAKGQANTVVNSVTQDVSLYFNRISYGYGISLVTENAYNPNYRFSKGRNTFYPKDDTYLCPDYNIRNAPESNFYNLGYKRMLSPRQFLGIDILTPISDNSFPTRIRPSFKHILNSLKDGYLQFAPAGFKDFDFQYGPINAITYLGDQLFSFQDDAINLHPINERGVSQSDATDTPFVLGESKGLTEFKRALSTEYGTQHQWSIVKGERGIYGFDWNKQSYWRVSGQGFENLGLAKGCEKFIEDIVLLQSTDVSDITEQLPDNPVCNLGIHSVYDREYKEVITTFVFGEDKDRTICFSEKADTFTSKYSFTPRFYSELERDLYSFKNGKFWRHDANSEYDNFYGVQDPAFVEIVVSPDGEIAKHFDNLIINSNNREFDKITYTTQHQSATQDPFLGEFWNRAIYREFQWKLPIRRADNIIDTQLSLSLVKSRIRGRYLIINLQYAGNQDMWIREIITAYTQSKA